MNSEIRPLLDALYASRSQKHLSNDPLSFSHRFPDPADREIAGLISSSFAYGRVGIILRNLETVFAIIGPHPRSFVAGLDPPEALKLFASFRHRFNDGKDLVALLLAARHMIVEAGSVEAFFLRGHDAHSPDVSQSLASFTARVLALDYREVFGRKPVSTGFRYLFPSPAGGSACKRLCMFLRWMVRPDDGIDLGVWKGVSPAQLVIPVDVHIGRIARSLGLTLRSQADWKTALEITGALRQLDAADPVKYDFSLCHLGISEGCDGTVTSACDGCAVSGVCRPSG